MEDNKEFERLALLLLISALISRVWIGDFLVAMLLVGMVGFIVVKAISLFQKEA